MKSLRLVLLFIAITAFLAACSKSSDFRGGELINDPINDAAVQPIEVTVPFVANFLGNYTYVGPNEESCGDAVNVIVDGTGTGTHIGHSTVHFDFCGYPQEDGSFIYGDIGNPIAYIVAANGDRLFVSAAGTVIPGRLEDHPEDVISYWRDPFVILGGTGRFEGASGGGMTDDYNSSADPYSHHHWKGTITLVKGKRK